VTSIDWHPNNILLATGSSDFKVRIFSAYIKDIEEKPQPTVWGAKMPLGQLMHEFANNSVGCGGWVHDVSFSHDGSRIVWVGHDSSISIAQGNGNGQPATVSSLRTSFLPFLSSVWINAENIVTAGHSLTPMLFQVVQSHNGLGLQCVGKVENSENKKEQGQVTAMKRFQSLDRHAKVNDDDVELGSLHQNTVTGLKIHSGSKENAMTLSSSSVDGQIIIWNLPTLIRQMQKMAI